MRASIPVIVTLVCSTVTHAQPFRFDMGPASSLQAGWTGVTNVTLYPGSGYGWEPAVAPQGVVSWATIDPNTVYHGQFDVLRDSVVTAPDSGSTECVFRVDIDPGVYRCVLYLGNVGRSGTMCGSPNTTPLRNLEVWIETDPADAPAAAATGLFARTILSKGASDEFEATTLSACITTSVGGYLKLRVTVEVPPGDSSIGFHFRAEGDDESYNSIQGVEIYDDVPLPIRYSHASGGIVTDSTASAVLDLVDALNESDLVAARAAAVGISTSDPLLRASALLWLVGWLDGSEEAGWLGEAGGSVWPGDPRDAELDEAIALLSAIATPNVAESELLESALDFRDALFFAQVRGYTSNAVSGGFATQGLLSGIMRNLGAAELLFRQIQGDLFASDNPFIETCPLLPRAEYRRAVQYYGRSTQAPAAPPGQPKNATNYWHDIVASMATELGSNGLFRDAAAVKMFLWISQNYSGIAPEGTIIPDWDGDAPPTYDPATTWWSEFTEPGATSSAPAWATATRDYLSAYQEVGRWWSERRLIEGEFGGGDGDDVELLGALWGTPRVFSPTGDFWHESPLQRALRGAGDTVLFGPNVNQAQGYFDGAGDSEHAGEYTTHPLFGALLRYYADPTYLEIPMRTLRNLFHDLLPYPPDDAPWMKPLATVEQPWHIRSYSFGATAVDENNSLMIHTIDAPINLRALVPALFVADFSADPVALDVLLKLADGWRDACMSSDPNEPVGAAKPIGIPPAAIRTDDAFAGQFGLPGMAGNEWWRNDYTAESEYLEQVYALLLMAYRHTGDPSYLEPIVPATVFVATTPPNPFAAPGSPAWASNEYRNDVRSSFFRARHFLYEGPNPVVPVSSTTEPDQGQFDQWLANTGDPYMKFVLNEDKGEIEAAMSEAATWLRSFFPLATTAVSYNDRAYFHIKGSHKLLYAVVSGGQWSSEQRPIVTWERPEGSGDLDVAPLVNVKPDHDGTQLNLLVHNFGASAADVSFRVWHRMKFGTYALSWGPAGPDDQPGSPVVATSGLGFLKPGRRFTIPGLPSGQTTSIVLTLEPGSETTPSLDVADPAVGKMSAIWDGEGDGVFVEVHNVGRQDSSVASIEVSQGGTLLGSTSVPSVPAPAALLPFFRQVHVDTAGVDVEQPIELRVVPSGGNLTTLNDVSEVIPATSSDEVSDVGFACVGSGCAGGVAPTLVAGSAPCIDNLLFEIRVEGAAPSKPGLLYIGATVVPAASASLSLQGCPIFVEPILLTLYATSDAEGTMRFPVPLPSSVVMVGQTYYVQGVVRENGGACWRTTQALRLDILDC